MQKPTWLSFPELGLFFGGLLWVCALTQPVFYTTDGTVMGYWVFATGWMGFTLFQFAWYANILALLGVLLMYKHPNRAMLCVVVGVLLAGQAFWFDAIPTETRSTQIVSLGLGFWLWFSSMVLITLSVIFGSSDGS